MLRKFGLPILALGMLLFAVLRMVQGQPTKARAEPPVQPARTPYSKTVSGSGIVEPGTENIAIGSYVTGVVTRVHVKVHQEVKEGTLLFELDDRALKAELAVRRMNLVAAQKQLTKLEMQPRPEEKPPSAAKVLEAKANLEDQEDLLRRAEAVYRTGALEQQEYCRRRQATSMARAQYDQAEANDILLNKGAWEPDKAIAAANVAQMQAAIKQTEMDLERLKVVALMPVGVDKMEVLQINVRPGEYVSNTASVGSIILGSYKRNIRIDIDEHDIHRYNEELPALASLRGDPQQKFQIRFVRTEPYVVPKKSLTGDNTERVDTRVLQVIYTIENPPRRLYVGQQLDVHFESDGGQP
jgi:HlyD family secretion protein